MNIWKIYFNYSGCLENKINNNTLNKQKQLTLDRFYKNYDM